MGSPLAKVQKTKLYDEEVRYTIAIVEHFPYLNFFPLLFFFKPNSKHSGVYIYRCIPKTNIPITNTNNKQKVRQTQFYTLSIHWKKKKQKKDNKNQ